MKRPIGALWPTLQYSLGTLLLLVLWEAGSRYFPGGLLPGPWPVLQRISSLLAQPESWRDLGITLLRSALGYLGALALGIPLGLFMGGRKAASRTLFLPTALLQGAPPLLWAIPLVVLLGTRGQAAQAVIFLVVLPLVLFQIQEGRRSIPAAQWDMFRIYAPGLRWILQDLYLPHLGPYLKVLLVSGSILGLKSSVVAEWFGASQGWGRRINSFYYVYDMPSFYASALVFLLLVLLLASFAQWLARLLFPEHRPGNPVHLEQATNSPASGECQEEAPGPAHSRDQSQDPNQNRPKAASGSGGLAWLDSTGGNISIQGLDFAYGRRMLFRNLELQLGPGQALLLTGDSGIGKTTLLKIMAGLLRVHHGRVVTQGRPAFLFQDDALLDHLCVRDNCSLPARVQGLRDAGERATRALELCGLADAADLYPAQLSGGMKKRLGLARALVQNPDYILLDEPFQNLQAGARAELWELLRQLFLARGIPAVIVTHYPEEIACWNLDHRELDQGQLQPVK